MKTQPDNRKPETLEDIVFEGRNKSYGAYDMNRKRGRYMLYAFLISFIGVSTAVAVPFINSMKNKGQKVVIYDSGPVVLIDPLVEQDVILPPKPPVIEGLKDPVGFYEPVIVEDPTEFELSLATIENGSVNPPVENSIPVYTTEPVKYVEDPYENEPILFPQEQATFMGGDLEIFRTWVLQNINYTPEAIEANVSGKIIVEFCVNSRGQVVDVKILRNLYPDLDNEALRVISGSPLWNPAKQGGRPVKQKFTIPITFKML
jgi:protein TonB